MNKVNNKLLFLFCIISFLLTQDVISQKILTDTYKYLTEEYIQKNIFSLQKAPQVNIESIVFDKITF